MSVSTKDMLLALKLKPDIELPDKYIKYLYDGFIDNDHPTDKFVVRLNIVLKFFNKILVNIGEKEIKNLTDFKNIDREKLVTASNMKIIEDMADEIFEHFDMVRAGWNRRAKLKKNNYVLTLMKFLVRESGLKFPYIIKRTTKNKEPVAFIYYSIEK